MTGQTFTQFFVQAVYLSTSSLYAGVCMILTTFNEDIRMHLRQINRIAIEEKLKRTNAKGKINTTRNRLRWIKIKERIDKHSRIKKKLLELIKFHEETRQ